MKKKIVMAVGTIAAAAILGVGIYHSNASQVDSGLSEEEIEEMVTGQYPGEIKNINLEKQANKSVYKVDIENDVRKYAITLKSDTGEVIELKETSDPEQVKMAEKKEKEKEQQANKKKQDHQKQSEPDKKKEKKQSENQDSNGKSKSAEKKNAVISVDKAIEIALEQFSGEVDEVELEEEDGRLIYEVEIEKGEDEAEVEIDAYTGEVLVVSIERDD